MDSKPEYSPGLEGVIAGESEISRIDVERNRLIIRGYDLIDLTEQVKYEEVAYLLLHDDLPTRSELDRFQDQLLAERNLPDQLFDLMQGAPPEVHPMAMLRTAISLLAFTDPDVGDNGREANVRKSVRLIAKIPLIIAGSHRLRTKLDPIPPKNNLDQASNLLYMLRGTEPETYEAEAMNVSLILYAEHGYNASAFAGRVTSSTLSDLHSAITTAVGTLAGPLHGGANEEAMAMLLEIGGPNKAKEWVLDALQQKKKIMGFGHREYKKGDSRVPSMKKVGRLIAEKVGETKWVDTADIVEETMQQEKGIFPNVDFPCGYAYYLLGIPIPLYTPIFVSSRVAGWAAHVIEQYDHNRLIRPNHIYAGPEQRSVVPLNQR